jgi:hypothetical protein
LPVLSETIEVKAKVVWTESGAELTPEMGRLVRAWVYRAVAAPIVEARGIIFGGKMSQYSLRMLCFLPQNVLAHVGFDIQPAYA